VGRALNYRPLGRGGPVVPRRGALGPLVSDRSWAKDNTLTISGWLGRFAPSSFEAGRGCVEGPRTAGSGLGHPLFDQEEKKALPPSQIGGGPPHSMFRKFDLPKKRDLKRWGQLAKSPAFGFGTSFGGQGKKASNKGFPCDAGQRGDVGIHWVFLISRNGPIGPPHRSPKKKISKIRLPSPLLGAILRRTTGKGAGIFRPTAQGRAGKGLGRRFYTKGGPAKRTGHIR